MSNNAMSSINSSFSLIESVSATRRPLDLTVFVLGLFIGASLFGWGTMKGAMTFTDTARMFWLAIKLLGLGVMFMAYVSVCARFTDEAVGGVARGMGDALFSALVVTPKALITGLSFLVVFLVLLIPAALLLLLCQIPGVGSGLQFLIFPVVAAILGAALVALIFMAVPLAVCALTQGRSVFGTVAFVLAGLRSRLMDLVLRFLGVAFIGWVVLGVLMLIAMLGIAVTAGLNASIQFGSAYGGFGEYSGSGMGGEMGQMLGMLLGPLGPMVGRFAASGAGGAALLVIAFFTSSLVFVKGWSLIYAELDSQVDSSREEAVLRAGYSQAKEKAKELQEKAQVKARELQEQAQQKTREMQEQAAARNAARQASAPIALPQVVAIASTCSQCKGPLSPQDGFCGNCGTPVART